ncbi:MAG: hypothetical protein ABDI19_03980 [Armatimonadota bacterium]
MIPIAISRAVIVGGDADATQGALAGTPTLRRAHWRGRRRYAGRSGGDADATQGAFVASASRRRHHGVCAANWYETDGR